MTGFGDMQDYLATPRVTDLALSPADGRLCITVSSLNEEGNRRVDSLWEIDPDGECEARRLTWSEPGESTPVFGSDGSLLFTSKRGGGGEDPASLWLLPVAGGEARPALRRPGGVVGVAVARESATVVVSTPTLAGDDVPGEEATDDSHGSLTDSQPTGSPTGQREARKAARVSAILHDESPVRYWDHDVGPEDLHLLAAAGIEQPPGHEAEPGRLRDLTPHPQRALAEQSFVLTPDGTSVITGWSVLEKPGYRHASLVAIDVVTGERRTLADEPGTFFSEPAVSWDGRLVACVRLRDATYDAPPRARLWLLELATGRGRELATEIDLWPGSPVFGPDDATVFFTADECGHRPVFRLDLSTEEVSRVTASGHHTHLSAAPDGQSLFALRDHIDVPPTPVRIDASATDSDGRALPAPGRVGVPGRVEDVAVTAADGTTIRSHLVLPDGAGPQRPAPLVLWVHGGPVGSWNSWSWRWNPWLLAAKGYAVLLPDPALSTGYGEVMLTRGWGQWGGTPYTDLMAATDAAVERADIDTDRTAAMGGSYGGYMVNWIAGHTDRFRCIVSHASVWSLEHFQGVTDVPAAWVREFGLPSEQPERYREWSPHRFGDAVTTPILVIHGDKDYRVPIGEGQLLWWELHRRGVDSAYLHFPDEGHWILQPGNARVWYETVWAWLARYVLDQPWQRPELL